MVTSWCAQSSPISWCRTWKDLPVSTILLCDVLSTCKVHTIQRQQGWGRHSSLKSPAVDFVPCPVIPAVRYSTPHPNNFNFCHIDADHWNNFGDPTLFPWIIWDILCSSWNFWVLISEIDLTYLMDWCKRADHLGWNVFGKMPIWKVYMTATIVVSFFSSQ